MSEKLEGSIQPAQPEQPEYVAIKTEVLNKVLGFVAEHPFKQVAGLINDIQTGVVPVSVNNPEVVNDGSKEICKE